MKVAGEREIRNDYGEVRLIYNSVSLELDWARIILGNSTILYGSPREVDLRYANHCPGKVSA